jgi:hypothetical protein
MTQSPSLSDIFWQQWQDIRQLTYDYLDSLDADQLALTLPFPTARPIGYQFWCMTGAHESYLNELAAGEWQGFTCSLNALTEITGPVMKAHMQRADEGMGQLLQTLNLTERLKNGKYGYQVVQRMVEHEMHHHGQLINLMFCHRLPIPASWQTKWALAYEE